MNQKEERKEIHYDHHADIAPIIDAAFYKDEKVLIIKHSTNDQKDMTNIGFKRYLNIRRFDNTELLKKTLISEVDMKKFLMQRIHHVIKGMIYYFTIDDKTSNLTLQGYDFVEKKEVNDILVCQYEAQPPQNEGKKPEKLPKVLCAIFVSQNTEKDITK